MFDALKGIGLALVILLPWHFVTVGNVKRERDALWIGKIRTSTGAVTSVIEAGDVELDAEDKIELEKHNAQQRERDAEFAKLKAYRESVPVSDACAQCRIPAERLRSVGP